MRARVCPFLHIPLSPWVTLSPKFSFLFFSSFSLVAPGRSGSEEGEGSGSHPPPGSWVTAVPPLPGSPSSICEEPHHGSLLLASIPGFVSPAVAHTMPRRLAFDSASLDLGSGWRGRDYSLGMLPVVLPEP